MMSTSMCLRCLRRSLRAVEHPPTSATFSTTIPRPAAKKAASKSVASTKKGRTLRLSKNTRAQSARPPAPGERKALKKRIVLSNPNALPVKDLSDLTPDRLVRHDPNTVALEAFSGQVLGLNDATVDALRALESFKPTQTWGLFRRPASLIRAETTRLANSLADAEEDKNGVTRMVLFGTRHTGKSVMLLQAHAMAFLKEWIVIHFPEAQDLTNAHTAYQPVDTPDGTLYMQPHYTAKLLTNIARANQAVLSRLQLSQQHRLPIPVQANISLARFAEMGANDVDIAWPIWQALVKELMTPSVPNSKVGLSRPPLLITLDGLEKATRLSAYLDSEAQPIHALDIALVRDFTNLLSGKTALPNGGAVLAATDDSHCRAAPTLDYCLARQDAAQNSTEPPKWDPFLPKDVRVEAALKGVEAMKMQGLSKQEARGVMEYYARSGMLRNTITEGFVGEKWTLAGSGIIGELERATVRARFN